MSWQLYEQFFAERRELPEGYPYKARTSLFHGFCIVAEGLLKTEKVPFIYATTHCSCWKNTLDENLYSREKPRIIAFSSLYHLDAADVKLALERFFKFDKTLLDQIDTSHFEVFSGRPGFLFDCAFVDRPEKDVSLQDLADILDDSEAHLTEVVADMIRRLTLVVGEGEVCYLQYFSTMHNNVILNEKAIDKLVAAGIAIKEYERAVICEEVIFRYYRKQCRQSDTREKAVIAYSGDDYSSLAQRAIALQILRFGGSVKDLIVTYWQSPTILSQEVLRVLDLYTVAMCNAGSMDEFGIEEAHSAFAYTSPLWSNNILFPRPGSNLPDLLLAAEDDTELQCLISIQVKTRCGRLSPFLMIPRASDEDEDTRIDCAILSTSRTHFFHKSPQQKLFRETWKSALQHLEGICHLRVIICWAGFTDQQKKLVDEFNKLNPDQPVILVSPTEDNFKRLYGQLAFEQIANCNGTKTPWDKVKTKQDVTEDELKEFEKRIKMRLETEETILQ